MGNGDIDTKRKVKRTNGQLWEIEETTNGLLAFGSTVVSAHESALFDLMKRVATECAVQIEKEATDKIESILKDESESDPFV